MTTKFWNERDVTAEPSSFGSAVMEEQIQQRAAEQTNLESYAMTHASYHDNEKHEFSLPFAVSREHLLPFWQQEEEKTNTEDVPISSTIERGNTPLTSRKSNSSFASSTSSSSGSEDEHSHTEHSVAVTKLDSSFQETNSRTISAPFFLPNSQDESASFHGPTSQLLDAAASLLQSRGIAFSSSTMSGSIPFRSMRKSVDRDQHCPRTVDTKLPPSLLLQPAEKIPEEDGDSRVVPVVAPSPFEPSQTIVPEAASQPVPHSFIHDYHSPRRISGDFDLHRCRPTVLRTGAHSFQVSLSSMPVSSVDALDILSNPDFLPQWCVCVSGLIVTKRSDESVAGMQMDNQRGGLAPQNRAYEGAWIEATTAQLIPPRNTPCWYQTARMISNRLGFPEYGNVRMFVERQRKCVGVTLGPFPGDVYISFTLRVIEEDEENNSIQIVNTVSLQQHRERDRNVYRSDSEDRGTLSNLHDLLDTFEQWLFLPRLEDYMEQAVESMSRLAFVLQGRRGNLIPSSLQSYREESSIREPLLG